MKINAQEENKRLKWQKTPLKGEFSSSLGNSGASAELTEFCHHCGLPCPPRSPDKEGRRFCCVGCYAAFELLEGSGLGDFYRLAQAEGRQLNRPTGSADYGFVDVEETRRRLVDFSDARTTRVTFRIESIHCVACVWLLENLPRLNPAIESARVNFARREVSIRFATADLKLSELVALLASIGYEPELRLDNLEAAAPSATPRRLWLQLAVAGFAFGNTMLLSLCVYLGLDEFHGQALAGVFGWISFGLAVPVLLFSAQDYWRSAWSGLRQGRLHLEVPITIGLVALFGRSAYELITRTGEGYFDSLCGLVFFLLIGRVFQRKTYDRLSFDRDYRSFFPLAACVRDEAGERRVALSEIRPGDRLIIRNGELIPADGRLLSGAALVDYSFVTGESSPVEPGEAGYLYAGGKQMGGAIEIETVKPVSQSYLASLWNQEAFRREGSDDFESVTNRFSPWFTGAVLLIALAAAVYWWPMDSGRAVQAFTAVLIVACPCALALAAPFALGTAQRLLGAAGVYLKSASVLERLARVDAVVFDKTGTLTEEGIGRAEWIGGDLSEEERRRVGILAAQSTHPYAGRIARDCGARPGAGRVEGFEELAGQGMRGVVEGGTVCVGSRAWLRAQGIEVPPGGGGATALVAVDGVYRGGFAMRNTVRARVGELARRLRGRAALALLSGDNDREAGTFGELFGPGAELRFNQSPHDKLEFIRQRQRGGATVMMVGDGLNDAGALKQADVGVAVAANTNRFSPACDVILSADQVGRLSELLAYARATVNVVRLSLLVSVLYNVAGLAFAARGLLSPVLCAILMPASSITVVALASGLSAWQGRAFRARRAGGRQGERSKESDELPLVTAAEGGVA